MRSSFALLAAALLVLGAVAQDMPYDVRTCTTSDEEQEFCNMLIDTMNDGSDGRINFSCVQFESDEDCLEAIAQDEADWRAVGTSDIYFGWDTWGLQVVASENYGQNVTGGTYYSVAVVPKEFCDTDEDVGLHSLRGTRSCHTGYRRRAGWMMPLGILMGFDHAELVDNLPDIENDAETMINYFSASCAAPFPDYGPKDFEDGVGGPWEGLCTGCTSDNVTEEDRCTSNDPYFSYSGAFRCLTEDAGDVAFVKHSTVLDYAADGNEPFWWSTRPKDDFRLICLTGGCGTVESYETCNLAKVPAQAVMANPSKPFVEDGILGQVLSDLSYDSSFTSVVFNETTNPDSHLFWRRVAWIDNVREDTGTYLGSAALAFEMLDFIESN